MPSAQKSVFSSEARGTPEVRRRAEFALQNMTPENLFRCGLTSDYAAECLSFLRSFDVDDPDVASVGRLFESFREHMSSLFIRGYVLGNVPKSSDSEPDRLKTMTQVVFEQVESPEPRLGQLQPFHTRVEVSVRASKTYYSRSTCACGLSVRLSVHP